MGEQGPRRPNGQKIGNQGEGENGHSPEVQGKDARRAQGRPFHCRAEEEAHGEEVEEDRQRWLGEGRRAS